MIAKMIVLMLGGNVCNITFLIPRHKIKLREKSREEQRNVIYKKRGMMKIEEREIEVIYNNCMHISTSNFLFMYSSHAGS